MDFLKSIIEKLKLKELFAIIFISALFITFIPSNLANILQINEFRNTYQSFISIAIIIPGAYYIFTTLTYLKNLLMGKFHSRKRKAIKYMKQQMSADEMSLLIEKYYDKKEHSFKMSAMIDITEGRKTPLEFNNIIYSASDMGYLYSYAYNLQPYILKFLNESLRKGNIKISEKEFFYKLK